MVSVLARQHYLAEALLAFCQLGSLQKLEAQAFRSFFLSVTCFRRSRIYLSILRLRTTE